MLDCPPNLGLITLNALAASTGIVVPMQAEYLALASLAALARTVEAARQLNPGLTHQAIALTRNLDIPLRGFSFRDERRRL